MKLSRLAVAFSFGSIRFRTNTNLIVYLLSIVVYLRSPNFYLRSIINTCRWTLITCARIVFTCVKDNYSINLLTPRCGTLSYSSGVPIWINSLSYKHHFSVYLLSIVVYLRSQYVYFLSILNTCGGTLITCARIKFTCVQDNYSIKLLTPRCGTLARFPCINVNLSHTA